MSRRAVAALLPLLLLAAPAAAETPLALPDGTRETFREISNPGRYLLPVGTFTAEAKPTRLTEGEVLTRVWHLPENTSPLALAQRLRPQLEDVGYTIVLDCTASDCGGFDFRVGTQVVPPPAMRFDLTDFHFLAAERGAEGAAAVSLLISADSLQAIEVTPRAADAKPLSVPAIPPAATLASAPQNAKGLAQALDTQARAVLAGIGFATGSRTLGPDQIAALEPLATLLSQRPEMAVVIVGHTDNAGSLQANIALSRARAAAVRQSLINDHGLAADRIESDGVGFLLPLAPNTSDENRALNRRVEVILR